MNDGARAGEISPDAASGEVTVREPSGATAGVCRWLRCRSHYGRALDGDWESGLSPVESYWCLRTAEPVGPDDALAHATECGAGRGCFRP